jgi:flagellar motility protein MotE (MotC chaperone)
MIARLLSPIVLILLALMISVALSTYMFWTTASAALEKIHVVHQQQAIVVAEKTALRRAKGWDFWTFEISNLETELKDQKAILQKKTESLQQQEQQIATERAELKRTRDELKAMQADLDQRINNIKGGIIEIKANELENLKALASTYTGLTPAASVAILKEMDDETVVKILSLMKKPQVIAIFQEMSTTPTADGTGTLSKKAADISDKMRLLKNNPANTQ